MSKLKIVPKDHLLFFVLNLCFFIKFDRRCAKCDNLHINFYVMMCTYCVQHKVSFYYDSCRIEKRGYWSCNGLIWGVILHVKCHIITPFYMYEILTLLTHLLRSEYFLRFFVQYYIVDFCLSHMSFYSNSQEWQGCFLLHNSNFCCNIDVDCRYVKNYNVCLFVCWGLYRTTRCMVWL